MHLSSNYGSKESAYNLLRVLAKQKVGLNIVHLNAQSLCNKIDEFRYIFSSSGVDIICISETWFPLDINDSIFNLQGFKLFRSDRKVVINGVETKAKGGGVAIFVRCGINCVVKSRTLAGSDIEYLFIEVTTKDKGKILIGSVYRPHRDTQNESFINILENLTVEYNDIIILGDFNNNLLTNNPLIDPMRSLGLVPINTVTPTHYHRCCNTLIDLVFVNNMSKVLLTTKYRPQSSLNMICSL